MNEAGVAPPGVMPIQQPTSEPRIAVAQYRGSFFQVCQRRSALIFADLPLKARPSSMVSRISPTPNRPITAIRKSKPRSSSIVPKVMPKLAGDAVEADRGEREAERHRRQHLERQFLAHADETAEGQQIDREELRRPEPERELRDDRREEGEQQHRDEGAEEGRGEAPWSSASPARPFCAIG